MSFPAYDEYDDSGNEWLGDVPTSWRPKRLKHVSPFIAVGIVVNPSSYVSDDGLPFIYGGDIREGIIDCENSRRISRVSSDANAKTKLEAGDVLTVRVGAPGVTAVVPKECEGGNCASVMLVRKGEFDSLWLCYVMNTPVVRNQVEVVQYGAAQKQFNIEHAVNFWLPVPDQDDQKAISSFLDVETSKIDGLVSEQRRLIELLKEKRQAVISHAVTKGLNPNAPMKPCGIPWLGDVPEHWEVAPLKYVSDIKTGYAFKSEDFITEGVPVLRIGDIGTDGTVCFAEAKYLPVETLDEHNDAVVHQNDIVMAMTGATIGKAAAYTHEEPALLNQRVCIFRAFDSSSQRFVWHLLQTHYYGEYLAVTAFGGAQPNISDTELVGCHVPIPPVKEQTAIAEFLDREVVRFSQLQAEAERAIELFQERRTALISAAVTGKIDVREFAYQETA